MARVLVAAPGPDAGAARARRRARALARTSSDSHARRRRHGRERPGRSAVNASPPTWAAFVPAVLALLVIDLVVLRGRGRDQTLCGAAALCVSGSASVCNGGFLDSAAERVDTSQPEVERPRRSGRCDRASAPGDALHGKALMVDLNAARDDPVHGQNHEHDPEQVAPARHARAVAAVRGPARSSRLPSVRGVSLQA